MTSLSRRTSWLLVPLCLLGCKPIKPVDLDAQLLDACGKGSVSEVTALLAAGANPNAIDKNPARKFSALVAGIAYPDVVATLLKHGARPTMRDGNGIGPVVYASSTGTVKSLTLLLDAGVNPNAVGSDEPPLSAAAGMAQLATAKVLIARGANVHFRSPSTGFTALHEAVIMPMAAPAERLRMVEFLLSHGAAPSARDKHGQTALDYATKQAKRRKGVATDMVRLLKKAMRPTS